MLEVRIIPQIISRYPRRGDFVVRGKRVYKIESIKDGLVELTNGDIVPVYRVRVVEYVVSDLQGGFIGISTIHKRITLKIDTYETLTKFCRPKTKVRDNSRKQMYYVGNDTQSSWE